jgi:hypothetical protein
VFAGAFLFANTCRPALGPTQFSPNGYRKHLPCGEELPKLGMHWSILSTDNELMSARNANLAAVEGSASGSNVRYYLTWKHSPFKEIMNKAVTMLPNVPMFAVRPWITTSPYLWPTGSLPSTCMLCVPSHCTKDVYTQQGSTRGLWTVPPLVR